jgi:hypothetical protein
MSGGAGIPRPWGTSPRPGLPPIANIERGAGAGVLCRASKVSPLTTSNLPPVFVMIAPGPMAAILARTVASSARLAFAMASRGNAASTTGAVITGLDLPCAMRARFVRPSGSFCRRNHVAREIPSESQGFDWVEGRLEGGWPVHSIAGRVLAPSAAHAGQGR